jgi:hypothetical protein
MRRTHAKAIYSVVRLTLKITMQLFVCALMRPVPVTLLPEDGSHQKCNRMGSPLQSLMLSMHYHTRFQRGCPVNWTASRMFWRDYYREAYLACYLELFVL